VEEGKGMKCEFCGRNKRVASTTFFSNYCKECIEILIKQCKEVLKELRRPR
jgi:hypothetical protein